MGWFRWRRRGLDEFAEAIRPELVELPVPAADEILLERILASRRAGARVILPHGDAPRSRSALRAPIAIAAALLLVAGLSRVFRPASDEPLAAGESWFAGGVAVAQPPGPSVPAVVVDVADRMRPLTVRLARIMRSMSGAVTSRLEVRIGIEPAALDGRAVWRVVSTELDDASPAQRVVDTALVSRADLSTLTNVAHEAPYHSYSRINISQRLDGLRFMGEMSAERDGKVVAQRSFDRRLPSEAGPFVPDPLAPLFLMGVSLHAGWRGSLSLLGWAVRDNDVFVPIRLRVEGEETIRVPAGEFACWRMVLEHSGRRQLYWVRKSDGLGIRLIDSTDARVKGVREVVLIGD
ncbi:MAG TPA: hypothetical protein VGQ17_16370 [Gemmatimonadales bacterium]|jgi:hypothetical protein|nr:hypothetical protein [Gemmatimonadales bacterium]